MDLQCLELDSISIFSFAYQIFFAEIKVSLSDDHGVYFYLQTWVIFDDYLIISEFQHAALEASWR